MEKISIDDIDPGTFDTEIHGDRRSLSDPLDTSDIAITYYVLEPGERFSGSVHTHMDQEEVFLIIRGTATFELREGEIRVSKNEAIRFAPGEFQSGKNDSNSEVIAFALGAPRDSEDVRVSRIPVLDNRVVACPECSHADMQIASKGGLVCPECGAELVVE